MTFNRSWYADGTISVNNASTTVTGSGTGWLTNGIIEGDYLMANGLMVPISAVNSNTSITLAAGWPGSNISGGSYFVVPASDGVRTVVASRNALNLLLNGNVSALAGLTTAANKRPYYTGAGAAALADDTAFGRALTALTGANGSFIRATGAGGAVMQAIVGTASQSGGVPTGALMSGWNSNANGLWRREADGTQICVASHNLGSIIVNGAGTYAAPYRTGGSSLTFPAAFSEAPVVAASAYTLSTEGPLQRLAAASHTAPTTTGMGNCNVTRLTDVSSNFDGVFSYVAIGRWY